MRSRSWRGAAGALIGVSLLVAACTGGPPASEEPTAATDSQAPPEATDEATPSLAGVTIKMANIGGGQYEKLYEAIPKFEAETGAKVEIVFLGDGFEIDRKLKQDFSAGTVDYDVAWDHTSFFSQYVNFLEPLDNLFTKEELADFTPRVLDFGRRDGQLWLIPRHADISVVHYRTDLWNAPKNQAQFKAKYGYDLAPPKTWDQLYQMAAFFNDPPTMYGTEFAGKEEGLSGRFYEQLVANGGAFFDDQFRPIFNDKIGVRTAQQFVDAYAQKIVPPDVTSLIWDGVAQNFCQGKIAIYTEWYGWYSYFQDPKSCPVAGKFDLVRQPVGDAGVRSGWAGAHGFSIVKTSQNKEAAAALVKFLTSEKVQYDEAKLGFLPVRTSVWKRLIDDAANSDDPLARKRLEIAQTQIEEDFFTPPLIAEWIPFSNILYPKLQAIILGDVPVQQGLDEAVAEAQKLMSEAGYGN